MPESKPMPRNVTMHAGRLVKREAHPDPNGNREAKRAAKRAKRKRGDAK
jgi:hypothetical protein